MVRADGRLWLASWMIGSDAHCGDTVTLGGQRTFAAVCADVRCAQEAGFAKF